jgi:hypothetical protein
MDFIDSTPRERESEMTSMPGHYSYPPKKSRTWLWVLLALVGVALICGLGSCLALGAGVNSVVKEDAARTKDVKITKCERNSLDMAVVSYTITNSGKTTHDYFPQFELVDNATKARIGTASEIEVDVKPGVTAKGNAVGSLSAKGAFSCRLIDA